MPHWAVGGANLLSLATCLAQCLGLSGSSINTGVLSTSPRCHLQTYLLTTADGEGLCFVPSQSPPRPRHRSRAYEQDSWQFLSFGWLGWGRGWGGRSQFTLATRASFRLTWVVKRSSGGALGSCICTGFSLNTPPALLPLSCLLSCFPQD